MGFCLRVRKAKPDGIGRGGVVAEKYIINPLINDGRFTQRKAIAKMKVEKYREIAHPAFIAAQARVAGED